MSAPANCHAMITITDHGRGEIAFGVLQTGLDLEYSRSSVGFTWEFAYHNGDEAVLKAKPDTSSTPC
jgi:hypothetical protein